ncbi:MAG: 50S ribosomal protein L25 [Candidatus Shapirobacteria bacterium]
MTKIVSSITAELRTLTGRKVRQLRKLGKTPATIYGHNFAPISVSISTMALNKLYSHVGESTLVEIKMGETTLPVLFKNPQYHPVSSDLIHIDCHKVNLKEKIIATVPLEFIGESMSVKNGNVLITVLDEIEVEALPANLPEKITVNLSMLTDIDAQITVADLNIDKTLVEVKNDADQVIVKTDLPKVEEEVVAEAEATPADVVATSQKTAEELASKDAQKAADKADYKKDEK